MKNWNMTRGKTLGPDNTTSSRPLQMCLPICSPTIPANYDRHNIIISITINILNLHILIIYAWGLINLGSCFCSLLSVVLHRCLRSLSCFSIDSWSFLHLFGKCLILLFQTLHHFFVAFPILFLILPQLLRWENPKFSCRASLYWLWKSLKWTIFEKKGAFPKTEGSHWVKEPKTSTL